MIIECYRCQEDEGDFVHVTCVDCQTTHRLCLHCAKGQKEDSFERCFDCELEDHYEASEPHCLCSASEYCYC